MAEGGKDEPRSHEEYEAVPYIFMIDCEWTREGYGLEDKRFAVFVTSW